jgi:hypothetical protein
VTLWLGFKRLAQLGWPKSFPIVQFPNAPLIIAFLTGCRQPISTAVLPGA